MWSAHHLQLLDQLTVEFGEWFRHIDDGYTTETAGFEWLASSKAITRGMVINSMSMNPPSFRTRRGSASPSPEGAHQPDPARGLGQREYLSKLGQGEDGANA